MIIFDHFLAILKIFEKMKIFKIFSKNVKSVKEVIFVKFGPSVHFFARGPEIQYNNVWSCKLEQGTGRNVPKYSQATRLKQSPGLSVQGEQSTRQSAASVGGKESDTCQAEECRETCTHSQDDSTCTPNMQEAKGLAPPV